MDIDDIIKEARNVLTQNRDEWEPRFGGYAENLLTNTKKNHPINTRQFKEYPPLRFYVSISNVKDAPLLLDVRYRGQSVAALKASSKSVTISTKTRDVTNFRDFGCEIKLNGDDWRSSVAREFRAFFKKRPNSRNETGENKGNEEHNVENLLLTEFLKQNGKDKPLLYIQPVTICGIRFSMPTPLSARAHINPVKYTKSYRGAIDLFARTGKSGNLTIIEIKKHNNARETPQDALKQGIRYAVFIRELLRTKKGQDWYYIFGHNGKIPKKLKIRVACAMPDDILDKSFAKQKYAVGFDEIECHYIYFKYDGKRLTDFQSSLG